MNEFEIISHYFKQANLNSQKEILLGIGDDAAIIDVPDDSELLISTDTLVAGIHFPLNTLPEDIAYKALAVNLSDMAAMGADPRWITLSLTIPEFNEDWFKHFADSFNQLAVDYAIVLIGGDLSRGPLSVTVQMLGLVPKSISKKGVALRRQGATPGDLIFVTGKLGAAAYALRSIQNQDNIFQNPTTEETQRLNRPEPRIKTGIALRGIANSCIDISDGLLADLGHILEASHVGAEVMLENIPYSDSLLLLDNELAIELVLTGGDDYELCFTLPADTKANIIEKLNMTCPVRQIGLINNQTSNLVFKKANGEIYTSKFHAYRHFD